MAKEIWLRLSAETSNDPKLIGIAALANVPFATVLGLWTHILCRARKNEVPGTFNDTASELACTMGLDVSVVEEIMAHMEFHKRNLIDGNRVRKWDKHQKKSDSSTQRVAEWRREQAAKKNPEKPAQVKEKQPVNDVVTLHRKVHPNVAAAHALGKRIMERRGVLGKTNLFNQLTSPLTPLFDAGIPESFIEDSINVMWDAREASGRIPTTFQYYVRAVKDQWDRANAKLEGTNGNVKDPYRTGTSRHTGEDAQSRRKAIFDGIGFASDMDSRRTGSG